MAKERWQIAQKFEYQEWAFDRDSIANEFEEARRKYQRVLGDIEDKYGFHNGWNILDIGCGPTVVGRLFAKGNLIGIDPLADELNIQKLYPDIKIIEGRGEELPFEDESFDVVFCRNAIDHAQSPKRIVSEACRVLKEDGLFLLACYVYTPPIAVLKFLSDRTGIQKNVGHPFTFTPQSFRNIVADKFVVEEEVLVHEGMGPHDYGKIDEPATHWSVFYDISLFLNFKVFRQKWFVREPLLICRKKG